MTLKLPKPQAFLSTVPDRFQTHKLHSSLVKARSAFTAGTGPDSIIRLGHIHELKNGEWVEIDHILPGTLSKNLPWKDLSPELHKK